MREIRSWGRRSSVANARASDGRAPTAWRGGNVNLRRGEKGQVLVTIALIMPVLLGIVALGVDVGYAYVQRRQMQNAADAGALAGVWELCSGIDPVGAATDYAQRNGAQDVQVLVDGGNGTVTVQAQTSFPTISSTRRTSGGTSTRC